MNEQYSFQNNTPSGRQQNLPDVRTQMSYAAFLMSIAGLALFSTFFFSLPLAGIAILLAVLSAGEKGRNTRANIALALGLITIVLCYVTLVSTMWLLLNSTEIQAQLSPAFEQLYGIPITDAVNMLREMLHLPAAN